MNEKQLNFICNNIEDLFPQVSESEVLYKGYFECLKSFVNMPLLNMPSVKIPDAPVYPYQEIETVFNQKSYVYKPGTNTSSYNDKIYSSALVGTFTNHNLLKQDLINLIKASDNDMKFKTVQKRYGMLVHEVALFIILNDLRYDFQFLTKVLQMLPETYSEQPTKRRYIDSLIWIDKTIDLVKSCFIVPKDIFEPFNIENTKHTLKQMCQTVAKTHGKFDIEYIAKENVSDLNSWIPPFMKNAQNLQKG